MDWFVIVTVWRKLGLKVETDPGLTLSAFRNNGNFKKGLVRNQND